jgi:AcrR family transcriptional regulator
MARQAGKRQVNAPRHTPRKRTQRERLLTGMVTVANRDGVARATVSAVIREAGVSRPTFYEYFTDKDDCFITSLAEAHERVLAGVRQKIESQTSEHAIDAAIEALVEFSVTEPAAARFVMSESMAAGPRSLVERDRGISAIAQMIDAARGELDAATAVADVSPRMAIGGIYRLLASRLRRGEPRLETLTGDLLHWIGDYARPIAEHRWRPLGATRAPAPSPFVSKTPMQAPMALGPGRPRISEEQVAANHRQRILYAAAQLAETRGYTATTISEITKLAGVDGRAFYSLFSDKQDAFMTVHELGFQEIMAVTAGAFFSAGTWPARSWEAARAFTQFLERNPTVAHVGFVEAFAVGPGAIQRVEDSHVAFAMFLQEGYQLAPRNPPSRLALEAIITTAFEIVYHQARASSRPQLAGLAAHLTFLWIAPFTGAAEANEFIDRQLQEVEAQQASTSDSERTGTGVT